MRELNRIDREKISPNALKVIQRLEQEGFAAYLVGGGVRDLLLGESPKDFDISTDARPEQIRQIFRNARIIGRRFRIVHVLFGREIIEVTTFRGHHPDMLPGDNSRQAAISDAGRLLRDNVYGTIEEDALRRDFTVNALYYSPSSDSILDYCNGLDDLRAQRLALIGDPQTRYREDPVRMLRAVRFQARLGFQLPAAVTGPIRELGALLHDIPPARMFDEVLKLFLSGAALETYQALRNFHLFGYLFPSCERILHQGDSVSATLMECMLRNTDARINADKPVNPAFMYAAFLWPAVRQHQQALLKQGLSAIPALQQAGGASIEHQVQYTAIPRRISTMMREIWDLQHRLEQPRGAKQVEHLFSQQRFRAAYDFLTLREEAGEPTAEMGRWWTLYQETPESGRAPLLAQLDKQPTTRKRKPRNRRRPLKNPLSDQVP